MMDEFAEKRSMVKMLMDMLKQSAADEVSHGMKAPEGMPADAKGLEVEKVSMIPHEAHDEMPMSPEASTMAADAMSHDDDSMDAEKERAPEMAAEDDMDDEPMPPFASLMGKKKIKK